MERLGWMELREFGGRVWGHTVFLQVKQKSSAGAAVTYSHG